MVANNGGRSSYHGAITVARARDLGDLGTRQAPTLAWKLRNLFERRRGAPALLAANVAGRIFGAATIKAKTFGEVFRPNWRALAPEQALRLKVLLQAKVDLTKEQITNILDEVGGYTSVGELARHFGGEVTSYGLLSTRLVTDNGVAFIVDAFQNLVELEIMKFHGFGTGTTAEAQGDSALVTELTTQYATDNTRPTGTTTEGASGNIYRTVATLSPDTGGTIAITEHGVFSAASAGTLLDRSKFSAINLVAGSDSLQTTYELTCTAGG